MDKQSDDALAREIKRVILGEWSRGTMIDDDEAQAVVALIHAREAAAKADAERLAGFVAQVAERDDSLGDDAKEALAAWEKSRG